MVTNISRTYGEPKEGDTGNGSNGKRHIFKNGQWVLKSPFEDRNCADCAYLKSALSWWCTNDEAKAYRGTSIPGIYDCTFWSPNIKEIGDEWLNEEQLSKKHPIKHKANSLLSRIRRWFLFTINL